MYRFPALRVPQRVPFMYLRHWLGVVESFQPQHPPSAQTALQSEPPRQTSSYAIVNKFAHWYLELGFSGASSHSGRRTFITNAARRISTVGESVGDVQLMAGDSALSATQRYIESDGMAQRRVLALV
jgi:hypothetical protein